MGVADRLILGILRPWESLGRYAVALIQLSKVSERFVGIDISKEALEVAVRPLGNKWVMRNNEGGVLKLVESMKRLASGVIVLEASGGFEMLPVVVMNPRQVWEFAKATVKLAKTSRPRA